jgi:hypothetical protein
MQQLFTHGRWIVKTAARTTSSPPGATSPSGPLPASRAAQAAGSSAIASSRNRFFNFGPWESLQAIEAWRASAGFQERVGDIQALLESFEAYTLDVAAEVEARAR